MKIVNVEDFFHPEAGYQINILSKYLSMFGHDVIIITSKMKNKTINQMKFFGCDNIEKKDDEFEKNTGVRIKRIPFKTVISGRVIFSKKDLLRAINEEKPDIVFSHGNDSFTGMQLLRFRKKLCAPIVFDSHMLSMASKNKFSHLFHWYYRTFLAPKIIKEKITVIRTQNDNFIESTLGIPLSQSPWVSYGSDLSLFYKDNEEKKRFRSYYKIVQDAFVVIYAGKLDEAKGGLFLANSIKNKIISNKKIVFLIVGDCVGDYGKKVDELFNSSKNNILRLPTQKYSDLHSCFKAADLCIFPKQCSLSFYDAQACGLPVLFEDNNINLDRSKHGNGWTFKSGDMTSFIEKLTMVVNLPSDVFDDYSKNSILFIKNNYDYKIKAKEYERILLRVVDQY